jgi:hypothetical protein
VTWAFDAMGFCSATFEVAPPLESQETRYVSTVEVSLPGAERQQKVFVQLRARFSERRSVLALVTKRGVWWRAAVVRGVLSHVL